MKTYIQVGGHMKRIKFGTTFNTISKEIITIEMKISYQVHLSDMYYLKPVFRLYCAIVILKRTIDKLIQN